MKTYAYYIIIFLLAVLPLTSALGQPCLPGIWSGKLKVPGGGELTIAITFFTDDNDSLQASLRSIEQSPNDFPFDQVIHAGKKVTLSMRSLRIEVEGTVDSTDRTMVCDFRQGGFRLPLVLHKTDSMPGLKRPQEPMKPFPYKEEEVTFENNRDKITLAGTLTVPQGKGPFPAVILISGSGPQNRNEELFGHKPFLVLADYLTRRGIAVLRFDDRGTGQSSGNFNDATTADFATDVLAALAYLKTRQEIDPAKTGLIGHSEGGMVAPMVAARSKQVAFIILLAGPGIGMDQIVLYQIGRQLKMLGKSDEQIQAEIRFRKKIFETMAVAKDTVLAAAKIRKAYADLPEAERNLLSWTPEQLDGMIRTFSNPWWRFCLSYQPTKTLRKVQCPVLALNGSKDTQVQADPNLDAISKALREGKCKSYTIKKIDGLNHLFQKCKTGDGLEYRSIEETINPEVLEVIAQWIEGIVNKKQI